MRTLMWLVCGIAACTSGEETEDSGTEPTGSDETTTFEITLSSVGPAFDFVASGAFGAPDGGDGTFAPIGPGGSYTFTVDIGPGQRLSLATMMVQSNDLFVAPDPEGIALWNDDGTPIEGELTGSLALWDAGTEADQEPGVGADQAPRQAGPDTGDADPNPDVRLAEDTFGNLPAVADLVSLTSTHLGGGSFELTLANVSTADGLSTTEGPVSIPLSPGAWAVHAAAGVFFEVGAPAPTGLEAIAEDGTPTDMAADLESRTGLTTPFAPGVWALYIDDNPLWTVGEPDAGLGLEALAEDGVPAELAMVPDDGAAFDTPDGAMMAGPLLPGGSYSFTVEAAPGDRLTLATMLVESNDLFVALEGLALFDGEEPIDGDQTSALVLFDAGTEVNQRPGTGPDQALRQAGPDTGMDEALPVGAVDDEFTYPALADLLSLTVTALP